MEGRSDDYLTYSHLLRRLKHDASSYSPLSVGRSSTVSRDGRSNDSFNSHTRTMKSVFTSIWEGIAIDLKGV